MLHPPNPGRVLEVLLLKGQGASVRLVAGRLVVVDRKQLPHCVDPRMHRPDVWLRRLLVRRLSSLYLLGYAAYCTPHASPD